MVGNKKKVLLIAPPFSGHLHPLLGLGRSLRLSSDVKIVSTPGVRDSVAGAELKGIFLLKDKEREIQAIANPPVRVKNNPFHLYRQFKGNVALLSRMQTEIEQIYETEKPHVVIVDFTLPVAGLAAEKRGIRWYTSLPSPCAYECPSGPHAYMGGVWPARGPAGRLRDGWHKFLIRCFKHFIFFLFRNQLTGLDLNSPYNRDGQEQIYSPRGIFALGMEELEFNRNCPDHFILTGPILYTPPAKNRTPLFVSARLHVLITFGTHLVFFKEKVWRQLQRTARKLPQIVFHFSCGNRDSDLYEVEGNLHRYGFISYADHLDRYDLVVHHCGSGIMYECIRHGIPAIAFPVDYDQFDNAVRLQRARAGVCLSRLSRLERTIEELLRNEEWKRDCHELSLSMETYHPCRTIEEKIF